jgi:hypothetical protein
MLHHRLLMATAISAAAAIGCSDTTAPEQLAPGGVSSKSAARSGALHITKECSKYFGGPGEFCTILTSNIKQIEAGSRVVYATGVGATSLDSDLILDPPGPGNNIAFGHVFLDFATNRGLVTFSGGTGKFSHFQASVEVSVYQEGPDWAWDGTYSFGPRK